MNWILTIPFLLGACVGSLVNLGVYRLAWHPRAISPWSAPLPEAPPRRWCDRVPILGWLGLRRESGLHGRAFWGRPMLVEVLCGIGFAALYWWEIGQAGLLPEGVPQPLPPRWLVIMHLQYGCHLVLISLMLVASLIDVDERIIPDPITVPGTLVALLLAVALPWSLLPGFVLYPDGAWVPDNLQLTSPKTPDRFDAFPNAWSLAIGLACWWGWCFALTHRTWYARHGWGRALKLCIARLGRDASTWRIAAMGLVGTAATAAVWFWCAPRWVGLLSALVGLAASGGIIWAIRIIGSAVLKREAMGFGDVTLMAMIGAFLGWQPCLIVFFLAPFAGLVVGVIGLILRRGPEIPYGPFLCMAALAVIVWWSALWEWALPVFDLGQFLILAVLVCLPFTVPLLVLIGLIRQAVSR